MLQLQPISAYTAEVGDVLAPCLFKPSKEKAAAVIQHYASVPGRFLYGYFEDGHLLALIGVNLDQPAPGKAVIQHLAVAQKARSRGIGRRVIEAAAELHRLAAIEAETDHEAVNFYRACGFQIYVLSEKYPGVERYRCVKQTNAVPGC